MANFKAIVKTAAGLVTVIVGAVVALKAGETANNHWPCGNIEDAEDAEIREMAGLSPLVEDSEEVEGEEAES